MRYLVLLLVLALPAAAVAQAPASEIRVTGEHRVTARDTGESALQFARIDAHHRAVGAAVARLQADAGVSALKLTPAQLEAYAAVLLDVDLESPRTPAAAGSTARVAARVTVDGPALARRMAGFAKDPDAARAVVGAWTGIQALHRQVTERSATGAEQLGALIAIQATHLAARSTAALARTEPSTFGGTAPTDEGRQRARAFAEAALALAPDSAAGHYAMGDALLDAEQPSEAEASFRKALRTDADSVPGRIRLAEALRMQGQYPESIAELQAALRLDPRSARAHNDLGMVLSAQENAAGAMAEFREAIRLDPDLLDAHNLLAITLARSGKMEEALSEFREVVRIDPDSSIGYYNLAYALAEVDLDVESAAALREVLRINPNHYNARFNLGELFRLEGKYDDSARQFQEFLRLAPDTPQNRRNITRARQYVEQFGG